MGHSNLHRNISGHCFPLSKILRLFRSASSLHNDFNYLNSSCFDGILLLRLQQDFKCEWQFKLYLVYVDCWNFVGFFWYILFSPRMQLEISPYLNCCCGNCCRIFFRHQTHRFHTLSLFLRMGWSFYCLDIWSCWCGFYFTHRCLSCQCRLLN